MSEFVVINFPDSTKISQGIGALRKLHAEGSRIYASAVAARDSSGKLSVQEITNEGLGGTTVGALIGGLAGLPAGLLGAAIGAAGGAIIGKSADLINQRTEEEFADKVSRELASGRVAIDAEIAREGMTSLKGVMKAIGGNVTIISQANRDKIPRMNRGNP